MKEQNQTTHISTKSKPIQLALRKNVSGFKRFANR